MFVRSENSKTDGTGRGNPNIKVWTDIMTFVMLIVILGTLVLVALLS